MKRTILLFPRFNNINLINKVRKRVDPLHKLIDPHITLVFPFESELSSINLGDIIGKSIKGIDSFSIKLSGISKSINEYGNYIFLDIVKGKETIKNLHEALYRDDELNKYKKEVEYIPHITLGKLETEDKLLKEYKELKDKFNYEFETIIDRVYIEEIGINDESIIVGEYLLK